MKYQIHEVERIARAERMLADRASAVLQKLVRDVAAACGVNIHEMLVTLRPDSDRTPEPKAHFVITGAEIRGPQEREAAAREPGAFGATACMQGGSSHR